MTTRYLLDADIFINSHQQHYCMDFCPAFWEWLLVKNAESQVFSLDRVNEELQAQQDELSEWAARRGVEFFMPFDDLAAYSMSEVAQWAYGRTNLRAGVVEAFLASTDLHLVTYALAHRMAVVTKEKSAPDSSKRIMIPDACAGVGVECVQLTPMIRAVGARFVLAT